MSTQAAFAFIHRVRVQDETLRDQVQASGRDADLEDLVRIGAEAGFDFTVEELHVAYKHDWAMRRVRYCSPIDA